MNHTEFGNLLSQGKLPRVLLFEGEEEYLKQQALRSLRAALLPEGMEELNETVLTAPSADEIIAAAETLPFLADRRLVLIRDERSLSSRTEAEQKLLDYELIEDEFVAPEPPKEIKQKPRGGRRGSGRR